MPSTAATIVFFRDGQARFLAILFDDLGLFGTMLPKVLAGCLIGAFVTLLLPRETVRVGRGGVRPRRHPARHGRGRDPAGRAVHDLSGRGARSWRVGADVGAACAFVISWSLLGYTRAIVWELPFFGLDFVTWRILVLAAAADPRRACGALRVAVLPAQGDAR